MGPSLGELLDHILKGNGGMMRIVVYEIGLAFDVFSALFRSASSNRSFIVALSSFGKMTW